MAALDLQEQEQLDALKAWWKDNGNMLLGVMLVALVVAGGWRGWQYYQQKQANESATLYAGFTQQLESRDAKRIDDAAAAVMDKYASSGYAPRAALQAALVNEGKAVATAKTQLQWVIDRAKEPGMKEVARLRLAAILLDEKNYAEAAKLLEAKQAVSFDALYADMRGDVLGAQGKLEEARSAYKLAYEKIGEKSQYRNLIQIKMDALGVAK